MFKNLESRSFIVILKKLKHLIFIESCDYFLKHRLILFLTDTQLIRGLKGIC